MITVNEEAICYFLQDIEEKEFNRVVIKEDKYQLEIYPTGITNNRADMFECWIYDGNSYKDTTLNNVMSIVQDIGCNEATIE